MALNERRKLFIKEYLIDQNATEAAKRAGYSEKTAYSQGHDLLKNPEIKEATQAALNKTHDKLDISIERIQKELAGMAFQDMSEDKLNGMKHSDKHNALVSLGKSQAMFTDKIEATLDGDLNLNVEVNVVKSCS